MVIQRTEVISRAFLRFLRTESAGGVVMLASAALALLVANSPLSADYAYLWHTYAGFSLGEWSLKLSLLHWVNDGLMAIFFFLVGLEIKREILFGELASFRRAALPVVAAFGGAVVPALVFVSLNAGGANLRGWGIPMATDIAFAVTILALLGSRAPLWLKTFVTALAIADDILAVLVIAVFYSGSLDTYALAWALAMLLILVSLNRLGVQNPGVYAIPILLLWYAVLQSGVHATIAGVAAAALIPVSRRRDTVVSDVEFSTSVEMQLQGLATSHDGEPWEATDAREEALAEIAEEASSSSAPLYRMEHAIHPWVSFLVLPIFAFANAGIEMPGLDQGGAITHPLTLGIILGLFIGKQVGITGATWLAVKLRLGSLAEGARWRQLWGGSLLAGIGFTMSIFIASLAFEDQATLDMAKLGVVLGSLLSAAAGILVLRAAGPVVDPLESED